MHSLPTKLICHSFFLPKISSITPSSHTCTPAHMRFPAPLSSSFRGDASAPLIYLRVRRGCRQGGCGTTLGIRRTRLREREREHFLPLEYYQQHLQASERQMRVCVRVSAVHTVSERVCMREAACSLASRPSQESERERERREMRDAIRVRFNQFDRIFGGLFCSCSRLSTAAPASLCSVSCITLRRRQPLPFSRCCSSVARLSPSLERINA